MIKAAEEAERLAVKQAKKDIIAAKWKKENDAREALKNKKVDTVDNSKAEKEAAAKIKREAGKKLRATIKEATLYCCERMPDSKYDKYFFEEFVKKYKTQEDVDELLAKM